MRKDITGIILCGGKSSRMQTNKALLKLGDKAVVQIILSEMKRVFNRVIISANECDDFSFLNIPLIKDIQVNRGPLSVIFSTLKASKTQKNFVTTCDLPLIKHQVVNYLININSTKEIVIPTINGIPERLFGIYNTSVIKIIEGIFSMSGTDKSIKGSVYDLHQRTSVELIEIDHLPFYSENMFLNMNAPEDYELIKNIYEKQ
jgi:molybdopterin-guanine dinucleotide biosynthesis protein A